MTSANNTVLPLPTSSGVASRWLPTPQELRREFALSDEAQLALRGDQKRINAIVSGQSDRLLVVLGPCSAHDAKAVLEYGQRVAALKPRFADQLELVMRCYVEKPRTTVGWKGMVYDPHLDGRHDLFEGLLLSRRLMRDLAALGLPLATEALSPMVADYLQDLVSWTAIGARTTESQTHREMASGLCSAVGFKNGTDGHLEVAIQAMQSAQAAHAYPASSICGRPEIRQTSGNPNVHMVLRGGRSGTNYDAQSVEGARAQLREAGLPERVMIDCSHGNSQKDYRRQSLVVADLLPRIAAGDHGLNGVMLESFLKPGKQDLSEPLDYGVSVTDACIGWEETERLLADLNQAVIDARSGDSNS